MKKNKEIFIIIIVLFCLLICVLLLNFILRKDDSKQCDQFEMNDIVSEINLATNNEFMISDIENMAIHVPINIEHTVEFAFAKSTKGEYFVIFKNLGSEKIEQMENYLEIDKDIIVLETVNNYMYVIFSPTYESVIEGIIRSYVYCD